MTKRRTARCFSLAIIFLAISSAAHAKSGITPEEYAVYSAVLRKVYEDDRETYLDCCEFAILDTTETYKGAWGSSFDVAKYRNLFNDFKLKNATTERVARRLPFKTYRLVSQVELDTLFAEGKEVAKASLKLYQNLLGTEPWIPFYTKYPMSAGLHTHSRVGFERNRSLGLVNVTFRSNLAGFSRMYVLRKKGREWRILNWSGTESIR